MRNAPVLLLMLSLSGQALELLNEEGKRAPALASDIFTPVALVDGEGAFVCNGFFARTDRGPRIATVAHCAAPELKPRFHWRDAAGHHSASLDAYEFSGDVESGEAPVDLAVARLADSNLPQGVDLKSLERTEIVPGSPVSVVYYHPIAESRDTLMLKEVACRVTPTIPKVRASTTPPNASDGFFRRFQIGLSAKDIAYDEKLGVFLDRCSLPNGASGAMVIGSDRKPLALLHTGVTTLQLALGWKHGGWSETFWEHAGKELQTRYQRGEISVAFHYEATDGKAYGPVTEERVLAQLEQETVQETDKGRLFLFGGALRLSEVAALLK